MKKGLSHKDLLLIAGIVVAVIVALTTWVYSEHPAEASRFIAPPKKPAVLAAPAATVKKIAQAFRVEL